jgi:hypothetical protein
MFTGVNDLAVKNGGLSRLWDGLLLQDDGNLFVP